MGEVMPEASAKEFSTGGEGGVIYQDYQLKSLFSLHPTIRTVLKLLPA